MVLGPVHQATEAVVGEKGEREMTGNSENPSHQDLEKQNNRHLLKVLMKNRSRPRKTKEKSCSGRKLQHSRR